MAAASGDRFTAKSVSFQITAGAAGVQAVALAVNADMASFFNCRIESYQRHSVLHKQDAILTRTVDSVLHKQEAILAGTADYIFGGGSAVIQNSQLAVRNLGHGHYKVIAANGKNTERQIGGLVIQNCTIIANADWAPEKATVLTYLARPWKILFTDLYMESDLGDFIQSEGYDFSSPLNGVFKNYCNFIECTKRGASAATDKRDNVPGFHAITDRTRHARYTVDQLLIMANG